MNDLNVDLNLNHYNVKELENLLNIKSYTFVEITKSASVLRDKIFSLSSLNMIKKQEIEIFLKDVVGVLERNLIDLKLNNILLLLATTPI